MQNTPKKTLTRTLFALTLMIASLAQITADMYVPSLPYMAKTLNVSNHAIQLTVAIYLLGFSFSNLYYGPLSDRIGRRKPLLIGIGLTALGGLICMLAQSAAFIMLGRLVQGLGVGSCNSVGRSFMRDLFSGSHLAKLGSHIGMVSVFVVAAAPTVGGYIQHYFGWRSVFLILFSYSCLVWILLWQAFPETNLDLNPHATRVRTILKNFYILLRSKTFLGYALCSSFAYAGLLSYMTVAPFILQDVIGLTAVQFGWLSFLIACSLFISTFLNSRYVIIKGIPFMVSIGTCLMFSGSTIMLIFGLLNYLNLWVIMLPMTLFSMGVGFTFSNAFAGAFHPFPRMAGAVGALYGCLQIVGAAAASALIAGLPDTTQMPLAGFLVTLSLLAITALNLLVKRDTETA